MYHGCSSLHALFPMVGLCVSRWYWKKDLETTSEMYKYPPPNNEHMNDCMIHIWKQIDGNNFNTKIITFKLIFWLLFPQINEEIRPEVTLVQV